MPETINLNDFSAGWTPSDDPVGGRKNGLIRLDNVELDNNGALVMSGGTKRIYNYPATVHSIFSKFLNGTKVNWAATATEVYRNTTALSAGTAASTRAAFGVAWNFVIIAAGTFRRKDNGTTLSTLGLTTPAPFTSFASNATGDLTGDYEYAQVLVRNDGNGYVAKSKLRNSGSITLNGESTDIDPTAPSADDSQANEKWIFRRGGTLDQWYRVYVDTTGTLFNDNVSDEDAIDGGITYDENIVTMSASNITANILAIVGPINGRHLYFTAGLVYFSEINSPDSTDPGTAISITGNSSELFLWARKAGENVVIVGTTEDVYILTGTFITQPDGTLDVYYRPLGVEETPISIDVAGSGSDVFYMAANGWVQLNLGGQVFPLCPPNTDVLYRGTTKNLNKGVPIYIHPTLRYSCCVAKNKLWCRVPQITNNDPALAFTYHMEVYDLVRKYWRTLNLAPDILFAEEDDAVIGFFDSDKYLKFIDYPFSKQLENGPTVNQTIDIQTLFLDGGNPRNDKETTNLNLNIDTGGSNLAASCFLNGNLASSTSLGNINSNGLSDVIVDLNGVLANAKNFSIRFTGQIADFRLTRISLDHEPHPVPTKFINILRFPLGDMNYNKVRIRTLPFIINTKGGNVTFRPTVDGAAFASATISTIVKSVYFYQFLTDAFGYNYAGTLESTTEFELWEIGMPDIAQTLPIAKRFYQVGPLELARYGKIKSFDFRIITFGGTDIAAAIFLEDTQLYTDTLIFTNSKESVHELMIPKTTAGSILRVELGPTSFDFHVMAVRVQAALSGRDTEMQWIDLK